jgi:hypothetical protein
LDEGWIKIKENYQEIANLHSKWYDANVKEAEKEGI